MDSITDICYDWSPDKEGRIREEYIKPLEKEIEALQAESERLKVKLDKAVEDLKKTNSCVTCKRQTNVSRWGGNKIMCNCIKEVQEQLKNNLHLSPNHANLNVKSLSLDNVAIMFEGGTQITGSATIAHEPVGRKTKTILNICYKYCPFCGKKYETEEAE